MKILFLCTHNACRSILGEVITRQLAGDRIAVASAGSAPRGIVHPLTLQQLGLAGYNTDSLSSKGWGDLGDFVPDVVITACDQAAGEACPAWAGKALKAHWGLPDPTRAPGDDDAKSAAFPPVIKTLERRIQALLETNFETLESDQLSSLFNQLAEIN